MISGDPFTSETLQFSLCYVPAPQESKATKKTGTYNVGEECDCGEGRVFQRPEGHLMSLEGEGPRKASWRKWYLNGPEKQVTADPGVGRGRGTYHSLESRECAELSKDSMFWLRAGETGQVSWAESGGLADWSCLYPGCTFVV